MTDKPKRVSPLQIVSPDDIVYTLDGRMRSARNLGQQIRPEDIFCTVKAPDPLSGDNEHAIEAAKDFSRHYILPGIVEQLATAAATKDRWAWPVRYKQLFKELPKGKNDPEAVREEIPKAFERMLDRITLDEIYSGMESVNRDATRLLRNDTGSRLGADQSRFMEAISSPNVKGRISAAFQKLPEWMQLLAHDAGAVISTAVLPSVSEYQVAFSHGHNEMTPDSPLLMGINPKLTKDNNEMLFALREEMIHQLQNKTDLQILMEGLKQQGNMEDELYYRWCDLGSEKVSEMWYDENHPALALIKQSEPSGGSVMDTSLMPGSQAAELLADIFDAEALLRKQGNDKETTARKLGEAFGDDTVRMAHEYTALWMDKAQTLLAASIGEGKAKEHRAKWEENPFGHRVTLNEHPKSKLGDKGIAD